MKVFIYRNLNRKGCVYSIKALEGCHKDLVLGYASHIVVADGTFKVFEAGRQRVLTNRRKNVHAGIVGRILNIATYEARNGWCCEWFREFNVKHFLAKWQDHHLTGTAITYNPYKYGHFYERNTLCPVYSADYISLIDNEVRTFSGIVNDETHPHDDVTSLLPVVPSEQFFEVRS